MDHFEATGYKDDVLWLEMQVDGNLWCFAYKKTEGLWVKDTKIKLDNSDKNALH